MLKSDNECTVAIFWLLDIHYETSHTASEAVNLFEWQYSYLCNIVFLREDLFPCKLPLKGVRLAPVRSFFPLKLLS